MQTSVFIATSLDNYIARPDGALDWLPDDCEPHGYDEFMATVDAMVIGRKTFEVVLGFGGWHYGSKPVIVLSSTLLSSSLKELKLPETARCEIMTGTPQQIVARLEERSYQHLYIDGGVTIQGFLREGLIDRMIVTRIPVLLGKGIPLFGDLEQDIAWTHVRTSTFRGGLVQNEYARLV